MDLTDWNESTHRGAHTTSREPVPHSCQASCQQSHAGNEFGNPAVSPWENAYPPCCELCDDERAHLGALLLVVGVVLALAGAAVLGGVWAVGRVLAS